MTMHARPAVTVVIPTRDRLAWLRRAVASAVAQRDVQVEVVVVDDGSVDGTAEWLATAAGGRVRALRHERSRGVSAARNEGLRHVTTPWVAFLDDDDLWAPANLATQIAGATRAGAEFSCAAAVVVTPQLTVIEREWPPSAGRMPRALYATNAMGSPSRVVVRTDAARSAGGFDERLSVLADWEFYLRLAERSHGHFDRRPLVAITRHGSSMQLTLVDAISAEIAYVADKHRAALREAGVEFGSPELSRWLACQHRRAGRRIRAATMYAGLACRSRTPSDAARAAASLLGERVTALARQALLHRIPPPAVVPEWLEAQHTGESGGGEPQAAPVSAREHDGGAQARAA